MEYESGANTLEAARHKFIEIVCREGWHDVDVSVSVKPISAEEAIGNPTRRDYPIVEGRERVIEAEVRGAKAHTFTDTARDFSGKLMDVANLPLDTTGNRALFIATLNAALKALGIIETTIHCRDEEPEQCADQIAATIVEKYGPVKVGLIGLNPAMAEQLSTVFGADNLMITDLNRKNIGTVKFGVEILDGRTETERLVGDSQFVLFTGTTLVNGTFDDIIKTTIAHRKPFMTYGVTAAGVCALLGFSRICPFGRSA